MGAMSMKFTGTVSVVEQDDAAHRALLRVKSREAGGQGYANADVTFTLADGGGTIHTAAQITGKAASMGEGVVVTVLDALIKDFTSKLAQRSDERAGPRCRYARCEQVATGEVPLDGGTAVQENPDRPVFRGNGEYDYVCVSAATCSPSGMDPST